MMISLMTLAIAAATAPTLLAPSGKWVVDYQTDKCLVSRAFGPPETNTMFAIKPAIVFGSGRASLFILTPNKRGRDVRRGIGRVRVQPSDKSFPVQFVSSIPKGTDLRGYEFAADADLMEALGDSTGLTLEAGSDNFAFQTGKMRALYNALDACNTNLLKSWGVDPAARAEIAGGVNPSSWFPEDIYPLEAKRQGQSGRVTIVLTVGNMGRVSACRIAVSSKFAELDKGTCDIATARARFTAAPGKTDRFSVLAFSWLLDD